MKRILVLCAFILSACQATPTRAPFAMPVSPTIPPRAVGVMGATPLPALQVGDTISVTSSTGLFLNGTPIAGANTPIVIAAASPTATSTSTPTSTATQTATNTATVSPSATATRTSTPTNTPTILPSPTRTNTPISSINLISNPGFESGASPWTWYGNASIVSSNAHSGSYAAQLVTASPWGSGYEQVVTGLTPNTTYALTAWARLDSGATDSIIPGVKEYDSSGGQVSVSVAASTYTQVTMQFTTGASNTSARIYCWRGSGTGSAYCDDFALTVAGSVTVTPPAITNTPTRTSTPIVASVTPSSTPTVVTPQNDWTFCVDEYATCSFSGSREVRFGANSAFAYGTYTNSVACDSSVFGDPVPGVVKHCDTRSAQTTTPTPIGALATPVQSFLVFLANANPTPATMTDLEQLPYMTIAASAADDAPVNGVTANIEICGSPGTDSCTDYHSAGSIVTMRSSINGTDVDGLASTVMPSDRWYRVTISGTVVKNAYWTTDTMYVGIPVRVGASGVTALQSGEVGMVRGLALVTVVLVVACGLIGARLLRAK